MQNETNTVFPKRLQDAEEIVATGSGSTNASGHWYDRHYECEVWLNDVMIDGVSLRDWSFGYDTDRQTFGKPSPTMVKIGDKLVVKTRTWGSGPEGKYGHSLDPFSVTEYVVVGNDYVFE